MVGQEFAAQVAKEKEAGLTVSVFMDVHGDVQLAKLQARNPTPALDDLTEVHPKLDLARWLLVTPSHYPTRKPSHPPPLEFEMIIYPTPSLVC